MSYVREYSRLFGVRVRDDSDRDLSGFHFAPTDTGKQLLEDHQLLFRANESSFDVYYCMNPHAADPLLGGITDRIRLSFLMSVNDATLYEHYEPTLTRQTGAQLYLDNLTAGGAIQDAGRESLAEGDTVQTQDAMRVYPEVFTVTVDVSGGNPPTSLRIVDKFDTDSVLAAVPIVATTGGEVGMAKIEIAELGLGPGPYLLVTEPADGDPQAIYIDDYVAAAGVNGVVDVYWETPQDQAPAGGVQFTIPFKER